ncbi:MAG: PHP domain-containing protein [Eubacterium sp.]|nr:PHP domain-containing protein [Eubacterium sp.]
MQLIDLHMHSTFSDGTDTPTELVELALEKDLVAMALTDHDTVDGVAEAVRASEGKPIEVIPGVEISCEYVVPPLAGQPSRKKEIHILGYGMDIENQALLDALQFARDERDNRNKKMCRNFEEAGYDMISYDKLLERFGNSTIARPHFARLLMEAGVIPSISAAFADGGLLSNESPLYVFRTYLTPEQGIQAILGAGGKAVLAHPMMYKLSVSEIHRMLYELKGFGLTGIEALYSRNKGTDEAFVRKLAHEFGLFITGGTDYHGRNKPDLEIGWGEGDLRIPVMLLSNLR